MIPSKLRILVCAPTNTALVQLASRLVSLVDKSTETKHLLGNIILFGSDKLSSCWKKTDKTVSKIFLKNLIDTNGDMNHRNQERMLLQASQLVFCTPFMSARLNNAQYDILVIDEAAYLKECESMVPLSINGIKHLVLIGDDLQLQSVVKSQIAKEAKYGQSLFERLCEIDFIGDIFGNYSFINVEYVIEHHTSQSVQNVVEAAVATTIVSKLSKGTDQNKKASIGVISLYASQVIALKENIGRIQTGELISVEVKTIDSFQGDEKDIIILSTVRNNKFGNIGFLDSGGRANVALTRASKSVWSELVQDAKGRSCFLDARADLELDKVISSFKSMNSLSPSGCSQLNIDVQLASDIIVKVVVEEAQAVIHLSPGHIPLAKRFCSSHEDELAESETADVESEYSLGEVHSRKRRNQGDCHLNSPSGLWISENEVSKPILQQVPSLIQVIRQQLELLLGKH
ncbi:hypothetical protein SORBI_3008G110050 [Sorghum bicolor]|uniref:DNA2/NAM7 helicase-like C-terminal domain-containing protein n=1 Tax=Sorghum bicolor TaxID=4558 RepID=A0A1Z5R6Y6_SORBI|nr:hypothetical protein SORBI_3008G110050 [Sorghum bicolor]